MRGISLYIVLLSLLLLLSGCVNIETNLNETLKDYSDTSNLNYSNNNTLVNMTSDDISLLSVIQPEALLNRNITIASFNSDNFNLAKSNNQHILNEIVKMIKNYDIIAMQGINDKDGIAINNLMSKLPSYNYKTNNGYIFIYKTDVIISKPVLYSISNKFKNPPFLAKFVVGDFSFVLIQVKVDELNAQNEIKELKDVVEFSKTYYSDNDVFILGDLKADCIYYEVNTELKNYDWLIKNNVDTTTTINDCAYDRIIATKQYNKLINDTGVYLYEGVNNELVKAISSHYPVYIKLEVAQNGI